MTFIGPTPEQIRSMGDKATARRTMMEVGVPTVPGTPDEVDDVDEAKSVAREIGFPIMIKATAGGGGKGMRVAESEDSFERLGAMGATVIVHGRSDERGAEVVTIPIPCTN